MSGKKTQEIKKRKEKKQRQERIEKEKTRIGHRHFCPATFFFFF